MPDQLCRKTVKRRLTAPGRGCKAGGMRIVLSCFLVIAGSFFALPAQAETLRIAVAANFRGVIAALEPVFEAETGDELAVSAGATGLLAGQILNGAPFDLFLAADTETPDRLVAEGQGVGAPVIYAVGAVVMVAREGVAGDTPEGMLLAAERISIANPRTAPYGRAAEALLRGLGIYDQISEKIVHGRNVTAALTAVETGAADLGFVAASAVLEGRAPVWVPDPGLYPRIEQAALVLSDNPAAARFMAFLASDAARGIIRDYGYGTD